MNKETEQGLTFRPDNPSTPLSVNIMPRTMLAYIVNEQELDMFASSYSSNALALFGVTIGVFVSCLLTLVTASLNAYVFAAFFGVAFASALLAAFFGLKAFKERRSAMQKVHDIRTQRGQQVPFNVVQG